MPGNNRILLDVDPSIIDNNLLIKKDDDEDSFESLFNNDYSQMGKLIQPQPGYCIKTFKKDGKEKLFINICHTEHLPPPEDISEMELIQILQSLGNDSSEINNNFRIPMSFGELHKELDKGGRPCDVYDVAVNSTFYNEKLSNFNSFKEFFKAVAIEGVTSKYNIELIGKSPVILKNCKFMGKIKSQMIKIREKEIGDNSTSNNLNHSKQLIEEVSPYNKITPQKSTSSSELCTSDLPYQLFIDAESATAKNGEPKYLTLNIFINKPVINSSKSLKLDIGEDRVILATPSLHKSDQILFDIFLPYNVVQESCSARFSSLNKVLSISMPVQSTY